MRLPPITARNKKQRLWFLVACVLFFSIAFHALNVSHNHPTFLGEGIQAIAHGEDKKFLAILAAVFILAWAENLFGQAAIILQSLHKLEIGYFYQKFIFLKSRNWLVRFLRRGLLQPKPY